MSWINIVIVHNHQKDIIINLLSQNKHLPVSDSNLESCVSSSAFPLEHFPFLSWWIWNLQWVSHQPSMPWIYVVPDLMLFVHPAWNRTLYSSAWLFCSTNGIIFSNQPCECKIKLQYFKDIPHLSLSLSLYIYMSSYCVISNIINTELQN
jgi:hypothetical protein